MLLGKIEIVFAEGFGLQAGVDITFKRQNRLAGIRRREIWLPVMKASALIPASLSLMRISVLICGGVSFRASWINCWELSNSSGSV